jgi:hypothetical protein
MGELADIAQRLLKIVRNKVLFLQVPLHVTVSNLVIPIVLNAAAPVR